MEQPASKKRKLAPKADLLSPQSQSIEQSPPTERIDFEIFARHLQDAAVFIQKQSEQQPHTDASVLLLSWQDDDASFSHVSAVDQVFQSQFGYSTQRWQIPAGASASLKLGIHLSSFIQRTGSDRLVIIYYAGHSYVGHDSQVYWASNRSSDATRLKWNGLQCLMQDVNPDILLLLDTCFVLEPAAATTNGTKHIITSPAVNGTAPGSLTPYLVEALRRLAPSGSFNSQDLHNEMCSRIKEYSSTSVLPIFVEPKQQGEPKELVLASRSVDSKASALIDRDLKSKKYDIDAEEAKRLRFDEQRVLACTTFVGDGNPGMEHFEHWLRNTPVLAKSITLEGMFLGPPTMLLVSMPISIWNLVQHDKVCCFLGYISSHNMLHMYKQLLNTNITAPPAEEQRDNRPAPEPRDGHYQQQQPPPPSPTSHRENNASPTYSLPRIQTLDRKPPRGPPYGVPYKREDGRDSVEMKEAAEQLKALSHINFPRNNEPSYAPAPRKSLPASLPTPNQPQYHSQERESQSSPNSSFSTTPTSKKMNDPSKYEVRCNHCSHAPFKDVSSLRKHIAAAHTRPFPCAFAFAGCLSTFGSKNEWKRHIASQHLCLQFYRCSACPYNANSPDSRGNEFNRKDLFTQHLRRMHAPAQVKRSGSSADVKAQADWEAQVKDMQHSCLVTRRRPPQQSACPKPGCGIVFDGASAWDDWTEHVGRHMERGDADNLAPDRLLIAWALREGIVEGRDGMYRLCPEQRMHSS